MLTKIKWLYVNTKLAQKNKGIWGEYYNGYEVNIKNRGRYVLKFSSQGKAIEMYPKIKGHCGIGMVDGVITIDKDDKEAIVTLECGENAVLAKNLVKHLRKQWFDNHNQTIKRILAEYKANKKIQQQATDNTGIKL